MKQCAPWATAASLSDLRRVLAALWALARAALAPRLARQVECDEVLARARDGMRAQLEAAGAEVHGGSLPRVRADARQLERVFRVLIGNAARHRGAEAPLIHISARPVGRDWLFSVRDNGTGVDPQQHREIFHAASGARELPGCRRIVRRHGGRMWVESARGHGATFYFTLPATRRKGYVF
jgi:light-regulated signal transduction histidine kinase (bacteriophytochrome)